MIISIKKWIKKHVILYRILSSMHSTYSKLMVPIRVLNNFRRVKKYYYNTSDNLILEAIRALEKNRRSMIPFDFIQKYQNLDYKIFNEFAEYPSISILGNQVYFPKETTTIQIFEAVKTHFIEQDPESPHRYINNKAKIKGHSAVLIGASDGLFALELFDSFQHIFLFESDPKWIEPLKKTFEHCYQKITIVNKFVSDKTSGKEIRLDDYFKDYIYPIDFLQSDVEGTACLVLKGAESILHNNVLKLAIACYHNSTESFEIQKILINSGFKISFSKKFVYMWMHNLKEPYFRNGVLYAQKDQETN